MATIEERKDVLLKAAYELLSKQEGSSVVLNLLEETVHYDGADCDGGCLREDIATILNVTKDTQTFHVL